MTLHMEKQISPPMKNVVTLVVNDPKDKGEVVVYVGQSVFDPTERGEDVLRVAREVQAFIVEASQ